MCVHCIAAPSTVRELKEHRKRIPRPKLELGNLLCQRLGHFASRTAIGIDTVLYCQTEKSRAIRYRYMRFKTDFVSIRLHIEIA